MVELTSIKLGLLGPFVLSICTNTCANQKKIKGFADIPTWYLTGNIGNIPLQHQLDKVNVGTKIRLKVKIQKKFRT